MDKVLSNVTSNDDSLDIISSENDSDKVVISGTGFSNTGVYLSSDGGGSFTALDTDIPSATFYEVIFDDSEEYLYAATSEGPYVYSFNENKWFDLIEQVRHYLILLSG